MHANGECIPILKCECATDVCSPRSGVRQSIFEYIEVWYNRQGRYSALSYAGPEISEKRFRKADRVSTNLGSAQKLQCRKYMPSTMPIAAIPKNSSHPIREVSPLLPYN